MVNGMSVMFSAHNSASAAVAPTPELLKVVAVLCQASQGKVPLLNALRETALAIGADVISISRVDLSCEKGSAKVLSADVRHQRPSSSGSFDFCVAPAVCGVNMKRAKSGSAWFGSMNDFADHARLSELYKNRRLSESVSILLERQNGVSDFLELHFCRPISSALANALTLMGPVLSDCWKKRSLGRFSETQLVNARRKSVRTEVKEILSMENPCRLSRAEYRVCLLLARGLNNNALLSELSISISTLRTHLRNIYIKTGTSSQTELIHDLLTPIVNPKPASAGGAYVA